MRNETSFEWLGERLSQHGVCIIQNINMTPTKPDRDAPPREQTEFNRQVKAAQDACSACTVKPECFVYSLHFNAVGIIAHGLERDRKNKLTSLYQKSGLHTVVEHLRAVA